MNRRDWESMVLEWIRIHSEALPTEGLSRHAPLLRQRVITSLQLTELLLYMEEVGGRSIRSSVLPPGAFHSVATMSAQFFPDQPDTENGIER